MQEGSEPGPLAGTNNTPTNLNEDVYEAKAEGAGEILNAKKGKNNHRYTNKNERPFGKLKNMFKELKKGVKNVFKKKTNLTKNVANARTFGPNLAHNTNNYSNYGNNGEIVVPKQPTPQSTIKVAEPMVVIAPTRRNRKTRRSHRMRR